ncbi:unnamed protein product [Bubo scandiacus]
MPSPSAPFGHIQNKFGTPQMTLTEFSYCKIVGMTLFERKKDESTFIFSIIPEAAELHIRANGEGVKEQREHPTGLGSY